LSLAIIRDWKFVAIAQPKQHRQTKDQGDTPETKRVTTASAEDASNQTLGTAGKPAETDEVSKDPPKTAPAKLSLFKENAVVVDSKQSQGAMEFDMSSFF
jgi:hypothetical protein